VALTDVLNGCRWRMSPAVVVRGRWRRLALGSGGWRARRLEDNGGDRVLDDDDGNAVWEGDDETYCVRRSGIPDDGIRPGRPLPRSAEDRGREGGHRMSHTRTCDVKAFLVANWR
jgi:hypothetical protein